MSHVLLAAANFLDESTGVRELKTAEEHKHHPSMLPRHEMWILEAVYRLET